MRSKKVSVEQENGIAKRYNGTRSPSSGAAVHDSGDVANKYDLIECKTHVPDSKKKKLPSMKEALDILEKITKEAIERDKSPVVNFRFYLPEHYLANRKGWVEISVRRTIDDADRAVAILDLEDKVDQLQWDIVELESQYGD